MKGYKYNKKKDNKIKLSKLSNTNNNFDYSFFIIN